MKKMAKKLVLAKETVRDLMAADQAKVRAGYDGTVSQCADADCTKLCYASADAQS